MHSRLHEIIKLGFTVTIQRIGDTTPIQARMMALNCPTVFGKKGHKLLLGSYHQLVPVHVLFLEDSRAVTDFYKPHQYTHFFHREVLEGL